MRGRRDPCAWWAACWQVVAVLVALLFLSGCGSSGPGDGGAPSSTRPTGPQASTTTSPPGAGAADIAKTRARWVGTAWTPTVGRPTVPFVAGRPLDLSSVASLCQGTSCAYGLDLLHDGSVSGAPPPGRYILWSSRALAQLPDGRPSWQVVDALPVTIEPGTTTILCNRADDPLAAALGTTSVDLPASGTVTADRVWISGPTGSIRTPDPADYRCEVGQD